MKIVLINKRKVLFPEQWEEITAKQACEIAPLLILDNWDARLSIVKIFITNAAKRFFYRMTPVQVFDLTQLIEWMFKIDMSVPVINKIKVEGVDYYLPEAGLKRSTIIEYAYADRFFEMIVAGDFTKVNNLVLCLCRPATSHGQNATDWDGDMRERFNPVLIEKRLPKMEKIDFRLKIYVLLFFVWRGGDRYNRIFPFIDAIAKR